MSGFQNGTLISFRFNGWYVQAPSSTNNAGASLSSSFSYPYCAYYFYSLPPPNPQKDNQSYQAGYLCSESMSFPDGMYYSSPSCVAGMLINVYNNLFLNYSGNSYFYFADNANNGVGTYFNFGTSCTGDNIYQFAITPDAKTYACAINKYQANLSYSHLCLVSGSCSVNLPSNVSSFQYASQSNPSGGSTVALIWKGQYITATSQGDVILSSTFLAPYAQWMVMDLPVPTQLAPGIKSLTAGSFADLQSMPLVQFVSVSYSYFLIYDGAGNLSLMNNQNFGYGSWFNFQFNQNNQQTVYYYFSPNGEDAQIVANHPNINYVLCDQYTTNECPSPFQN